MDDSRLTFFELMEMLRRVWKLLVVIVIIAMLVVGGLIVWCLPKNPVDSGFPSACIEVLLGIASFVTAIVAIAWARTQWIYDKDCKRVEQFNSLLQLYTSMDVVNLLGCKDRELRLRGFSCLSHIAYVLDHEMLNKHGHQYFENELKRLLAQIDVKSFNADYQGYETMFTNLNKFYDENLVQSPDTDSCSDQIDQHGECLNIPITADELNSIPCLVVRLSRQFYDGMSVDELYSATRGYWRIDENKAQKARYALSVGLGIVQEVYKINGWHSVAGNEISRRKQFDGEVACKEVREKYKGRSVRGLFSRGDQYPIRYYGI